MRHVISVTVENKPGVLAHISSLFAARGYSIDSLAVGETEDPNLSRMTIVTRGDDQIIEQITKQLRKLISTLKVQDLGEADYIERDLVLIKVGVPSGKRSEILEVAGHHIPWIDMVDPPRTASGNIQEDLDSMLIAIQDCTHNLAVDTDNKLDVLPILD